MLINPGFVRLALITFALCLAQCQQPHVTVAQNIKPLRVLEFADNTPTHQLPQIGNSAEFTYSADGKKIAASWIQGIFVFDAKRGKPKSFIKTKTFLTGMQFSKDGQIIGGRYGKDIAIASFWKTRKGKLLTEIKVSQHENELGHFAFSPATKLAAISDKDEVKIHECESGKLQHTFDLSKNTSQGIRCLTFSPDGKLLAVALTTGVYLLNIQDKKIESKIPPTGNLVDRLFYSPDGRYLASTNLLSEGVCVWEIKSKKLVARFGEKRSDPNLECVCFSPNSNLIAIGGGQPDNYGNPYMEVFEFPSKKSVANLSKFFKFDVVNMQFSPDGKQLAATCVEETSIRVFDTSKAFRAAKVQK